MRFNTVVRLFATWFGCGLSPRAPGTVGTLGAIPLVWVLARLGPLPYLGFTLFLAVAGVIVAQFYEEFLAGGEHDRPEFVLDEVVGFLITMALVPLTPLTWLAGFALFRAFDIWKPYPISWVDRHVPGGFGAMADDLLAGIFSSLALQVALHYQILPGVS